jgi:hypothetical protein
VLLFGGNASDRDGFDGDRRDELAKLDKNSKKKTKTVGMCSGNCDIFIGAFINLDLNL